MQANLELDLVFQEMKHYIVLIVWLLLYGCYVLDPAGLKLSVDNYLSKEGSMTKLYMSSNVIALIKRNYNRVSDLFYMLISLCFSTSGAEEF